MISIKQTQHVAPSGQGATPSDLPVQPPINFELAANLKTTTALGVTVAPSLVAAVDEVSRLGPEYG